MHMRDWDDYRFVAAVGQAGGLAAAARVLGVHHSTVFRRIAALEAATGVRLFDRLPDGYRPTPAGEAVLSALGQAETAIHAVERRLTGEVPDLSGSVRVTTAEDIAEALVSPNLAKFNESYPDIRLELIVDNRFFNLSRREADIAFRPGRDPEGDMVGRRCGPLAFAHYASDSYLARAGHPEGPADLSLHKLIGCDDSLAHVAPARWLKRHETGDNVAVRSNSFLIQRAAVRAGLGIGLLPCFLADGQDLVRLWAPPADLDSELWVLTHRDLRATPRIRAVLDYFYDAFVDARDLLAGSRVGQTG